MNGTYIDTPVLLLGFNRPREISLVLGKLKDNRVRHLFVSVDGPRLGIPEEAAKVSLVRKLVLSADWDCRVETLFNEHNLGLKRSVSQAIEWFFGRVERGIILEDDCVPSSDFFRFCQTMLEVYKDDKRIMTVSGNNFHYSFPGTISSYYFSKYPLIWGWATWKRAWEMYDYSMAKWPEARAAGWLHDILKEKRYVKYWDDIFQRTYADENSSWAYRWIFANWMNSGLTILPASNLVSNIGFSEEATHTRKKIRVANAQTEKLEFPLTPPEKIVFDPFMDKAIQEKHFSLSWYQKVRHKMYMTGIINKF